ncbi:MAG: hypothetical protein AAFX06_30190 [Planctomycetota bacterium]
MKDLSRSNFGIVIAYLLPGLIGIAAASQHFAVVQMWLRGPASDEAASVGGFLFAAFGALLLGLLFSTARWLVLDAIHHRTGVKPAKRDFSLLQANLEAYRMIEENHYQYYQFYGNSLVAVVIGYASYRVTNPSAPSMTDLVAAAVALLLFLGSRDTLKKYYARVQALMTTQNALILRTSPPP